MLEFIQTMLKLSEIHEQIKTFHGGEIVKNKITKEFFTVDKIEKECPQRGVCGSFNLLFCHCLVFKEDGSRYLHCYKDYVKTNKKDALVYRLFGNQIFKEDK